MRGLALSGGGIKAAAHIGALKAFEEKNIKFDCVSGASSGSIVATLYACGYTAEEIYDLFAIYAKKIKYVDWRNILKLIGGLIITREVCIDGLNSGKVIENIVNQACKAKGITNIRDINKNLLIPSIDLNTGAVYFFSSINESRGYSDKIRYVNDIEIGKAVRASCSYPGVFSPCPYKETVLVDGGIRENVPWKELKENGVDVVISVVFTKDIKYKTKKNILDVIGGSIDIMGHELSNYELEGADYLLKIHTEDVSLLDASKMEYLYKRGYEEAKRQIRNIR